MVPVPPWELDVRVHVCSSSIAPMNGNVLPSMLLAKLCPLAVFTHWAKPCSPHHVLT